MASVNSAYKLRYQTYFSSWCERTWRVQIYDRKWTDPNNIGAQLFNLGEGGVEITYDTDGNDKSSPIVGSKCAIDFMFEDGIYDNNNWFGDLLGYNTSSYLPYEDLFNNMVRRISSRPRYFARFGAAVPNEINFHGRARKTEKHRFRREKR